MDRLPDDEAARLEWLRRWGTEQWRQAEQRRTNQRTKEVASWRPGLASRVLRRGLRTSGRAIEPEHAHPDRSHYLPSPWHVLSRALHYLGVSERDVFVEFGCGKGRVVHQAAKRPFRRVIGVEISPVLAEVARTNLAARRRQQRCKSVEIVVCDVAEYRVPDDLTIGYFFQPFIGQTFETVLQGIIDSIDRHPRRVRLIYVLPLRGTQVLATGRFRLLKELRGGLRPAADRQYRAAIYESR
jgi:SAM-dependent methyltransferase